MHQQLGPPQTASASLSHGPLLEWKFAAVPAPLTEGLVNEGHGPRRLTTMLHHVLNLALQLLDLILSRNKLVRAQLKDLEPLEVLQVKLFSTPSFTLCPHLVQAGSC